MLSSAATPYTPSIVAGALGRMRRTAADMAPPLAREPKSAADRSRESQEIDEALRFLRDALAPQRRVVCAGDVLYQAGESFNCLYVLNAGFIKLTNAAADGREQVVGFKFKGDWLGLDGIDGNRYRCDAVAMDTGEVWSVPYEALMLAALKVPRLLSLLHAAMSRQIGRDRESLMSVCTLPADARVAEFLRYWAESLACRGLRNDKITLRMTRAEIGNYLGMTLETVSRALSKLARARVIEFAEKGRKDFRIPDVEALTAFIQGCLSSTSPARELQ